MIGTNSVLTVMPNVISTQNGATITFIGEAFKPNSKGNITSNDGTVISPYSADQLGNFKVIVRYMPRSGLALAIANNPVRNFMNAIAIDSSTKSYSNHVSVYF
jgi:hypothetical protein